MAYIGAQPRLGNFQACDAITASATTTFNLLVGGTAIFPQSAQHCLVSLNGVLQAPISSYTISGSTIVFAAALTTDDSIDFITVLGDVLDLGVPSDGVVGNTQLADAVKVGKQTMWIPSVAMYPSNTSGCAALAGTELASDINKPFLQVLAFDKDSDEAAQFSVAFPKSWNEGTITFQPFFTANTTNTGDVKFMLKGVAISDNDALNTDFGTAQGTAKSHSGTAYDLNVGAESSAITIAGSPAAGDQVFFQIFRDVSADNMSADALLTGIKIHFTVDAANDA